MLINVMDGPSGTPKLIRGLHKEYYKRYKEKHGKESKRIKNLLFEGEVLCERDPVYHVLENMETLEVVFN